MSQSFTTVWHLVGALALLGAWAVVLGRRWRRIDDHPWCRRCRFDLVGSWPASTCPECGSDLSAKRAVAHGQRAAQPVVFGAGVFILILAMTIGIRAGYQRIAPIDWNSYKPAAWLVRDLHSTKGERVEAALAELVERDEAGDLAPHHRAALLDHVFESLVSQLQTTKVQWVPVVERAWLDDSLSEQRRLEFARTAASTQLDISRRQPIRRGGLLTFKIRLQPPFRGRTERMRIEAWPVEVALAEESFRLQRSVTSLGLSRGGGYGGGGSGYAIPILAQPGEATLHTVWQIDCRLGDDKQHVLSWRETLDESLMIEPAGPDAVTYLTDEQSTQHVREALRIDVAGLRNALHDGLGDVVGIVTMEPQQWRPGLGIDIMVGDEVLDQTGLAEGFGRRAHFHFALPAGTEIESLDLMVFPSQVPDIFGRGDTGALNDKPVWFGDPFTLRAPVQWFDDVDSPGLDDELRERAIRDKSDWQRERDEM